MDIDQLSRAMKDHEKRLNRIEAWMEAQDKGSVLRAKVVDHWRDKFLQFCECGREHCRKPDCPSHKPDPMGR